jgi:hypothetical protein
MMSPLILVVDDSEHFVLAVEDGPLHPRQWTIHAKAQANQVVGGRGARG